MPNNHDYTFSLTRPAYDQALLYRKFKYETAQEQVKFQAFRVPSATSGKPVYFQVKISITSLTPHFYPLLYLK